MAAGRLAGKVAIVTGAASSAPGVGIGKATATLFAREGATVVLVNRTEDHARELQRELAAEGGVCSVFAADVTKAGEVEALMETAVQQHGRLDILFNNVGAGAIGTAVTVAEDEWDRAMNVNLKSALWCSKYAIPRMIASGGGSVINVSTVAAVQGFSRVDSGFTPYTAAKAGLIGLTLAMAADHAAAGVRVNCLVVGMANTPQLERFGEAARERRRQAVPLQTEGTAWDVAWAAVYLASEEARWVTGVSLPIDGGQSSLRVWRG